MYEWLRDYTTTFTEGELIVKQLDENDIELSEDHYNLIVTVDESVLKACCEAQLQEWTTQGQLERAEYYRSRGVI